MSRYSWTRRREASFVIHCDAPVRVAILPSSVIAVLSATNGIFSGTHLRKASLSLRASSSRTPQTTSTPASSRILMPRPETSGFGSFIAMTQRFTPASATALAHGPVRP